MTDESARETAESVASELKEHYLGDGLYASFDGWQFILRATRGRVDHWVGLEPAVFAELLRYRDGILRELTSEIVAETGPD